MDYYKMRVFIGKYHFIDSYTTRFILNNILSGKIKPNMFCFFRKHFVCEHWGRLYLTLSMLYNYYGVFYNKKDGTYVWVGTKKERSFTIMKNKYLRGGWTLCEIPYGIKKGIKGINKIKKE